MPSDPPSERVVPFARFLREAGRAIEEEAKPLAEAIPRVERRIGDRRATAEHASEGAGERRKNRGRRATDRE